MGRPAKLTKYSVENALAKTGSVTAAADYAGVNRRSFQRAMRRFGVAFAAVSDHLATLLEPVAAQSTPDIRPELIEAPTVPVEPKHRPERNILRLTASDFAGPCYGDAGRPSFTGADGLLTRYHRLRGK